MSSIIWNGDGRRFDDTAAHPSRKIQPWEKEVIDREAASDCGVRVYYVFCSSEKLLQDLIGEASSTRNDGKACSTGSAHGVCAKDNASTSDYKYEIVATGQIDRASARLGDADEYVT